MSMNSHRGVNESEHLLLFGYACKLFRDDEKALFFDQGKHLIPWNEDSSIKIDRYDGRASLVDLRPHEAPSGGYSRYEGFTNDEKRIEERIDEERYKALHKGDSAEEHIYIEEEWKRLQGTHDGSGTYHEVKFSYDNNASNNNANNETNNKAEAEDPEEDDDDEPFHPYQALRLPPNIIPPDTVKQHQIIEKTATFIVRQGQQMEVMLKLKQANNPLFSFLSWDAALHPYYRHICNQVEAGIFKPYKEVKAEVGHEAQYLHPKLTTVKPNLAPSIPSIAYKPSDDCSYAQLVKRLKPQTASSPIPQEQQPETTASTSSLPASPAPESTDSPKRRRRKRKKKPPPVIQPPEDVQLTIDKVASYVAKRGQDFEMVVKNKVYPEDPRFQFLNFSHEYYGYYVHKKKEYLRTFELEKKNRENTPSGPPSSNESSDSENKRKKPLPVSFSIKSRENEKHHLERSALPFDEESCGEKEGEQEEGEETREKAQQPNVEETPALPKEPPSEPQEAPTVEIPRISKPPDPPSIDVITNLMQAKAESQCFQDMFQEESPMDLPPLPSSPPPDIKPPPSTDENTTEKEDDAKALSDEKAPNLKEDRKRRAEAFLRLKASNSPSNNASRSTSVVEVEDKSASEANGAANEADRIIHSVETKRIIRRPVLKRPPMNKRPEVIVIDDSSSDAEVVPVRRERERRVKHSSRHHRRHHSGHKHRRKHRHKHDDQLERRRRRRSYSRSRKMEDYSRRKHSRERRERRHRKKSKDSRKRRKKREESRDRSSSEEPKRRKHRSSRKRRRSSSRQERHKKKVAKLKSRRRSTSSSSSSSEEERRKRKAKKSNREEEAKRSKRSRRSSTEEEEEEEKQSSSEEEEVVERKKKKTRSSSSSDSSSEEEEEETKQSSNNASSEDSEDDEDEEGDNEKENDEEEESESSSDDET